MTETLPYRDFYYPLNVFMHVLTLEEGGVAHLHYGLFERSDEPISAAQERSTQLLLARLPPPPARVLEAGIGLGTTLALLTRLGYDAIGITPDEQQIAMVRARFGDEVDARCVKFEEMTDNDRYDVIVFQESSPTIDYFIARLPRYRDAIVRDLGLTSEQVDELITSGASYAELYRRGVYGYLLLQFERR
jgi:SAM-dependent methyltransferase